MGLNPNATFDTLFIASSLQRHTAGVTAAELHLFGYLACMLWLYKRHALEDWGYSFVGTELGAPFSQKIDHAIDEMTERGYLVRTGDRMRVSGIAEERLKQFSALQLNNERTECLYAACSSTSAFSLGMIGRALSQEPDLKRARTMPMTRQLLEHSAQSQLYQYFDALRSNLGQDDVNLRVPAVVWLVALYQSSDPTTT